MRKHMLASVGAAAIALALAGPAAAQTNTSPSPSATDANGGNPQENASQASPDSRGFLRVAGQDGRAEVALAELAATKAQSPEVKAYADRLHRDHEKANAELETIAADERHGVGPVAGAAGCRAAARGLVGTGV
jgi:putative membrane protein